MVKNRDEYGASRKKIGWATERPAEDTNMEELATEIGKQWVAGSVGDVVTQYTGSNRQSIVRTQQTITNIDKKQAKTDK